eukprot:sb/3475481/
MTYALVCPGLSDAQQVRIETSIEESCLSRELKKPSELPEGSATEKIIPVSNSKENDNNNNNNIHTYILPIFYRDSRALQMLPLKETQSIKNSKKPQVICHQSPLLLNHSNNRHRSNVQTTDSERLE